MENARRRILNMLNEGKISVDEAERLLSTINERVDTGAEQISSPSGVRQPRFLRIVVAEKEGENVDIRIPIGLLKAGMKLGALMPEQAKGAIQDQLDKQGINFDFTDFDANNIEELVKQLAELQVTVDGGDKVRIYCE